MIWGAQGSSFNSVAGHGAYSEAILKLDTQTTLYAYVGAKGKCGNENFTTEQYEGGKNKACKNRQSCTGGSATFISSDPYGKQILLISGAGGGSGYYTSEFFGGVGGLSLIHI